MSFILWFYMSGFDVASICKAKKDRALIEYYKDSCVYVTE